MSAYLKIDDALPAGKPYLDLSYLELPESVINMPNATAIFNFDKSISNLIGDSAVVGSPVKVTGGYKLGNFGFVDTKSFDTTEFTWFALVRDTATYKFQPAITNYTDAGASPSGTALGNAMNKEWLSVSLSPTLRDSVENYRGASDTWRVIFLSRYLTEGGFRYSYATKRADKAWVNVTSQLGVLPNINTVTPVGIGWSKDTVVAADVDPNGILHRYVSINEVGYTPEALNAIALTTVAELNSKGFNI